MGVERMQVEWNQCDCLSLVRDQIMNQTNVATILIQGRK